MASFTDNIPQFNPYIKQLPVEAMVQVGMEKQRRYDEGLQKIQSYVDNVAGLPVGNDADKAYLKSAINGLGSKLKTVAAGDFSNYQLVNSVGGMTKQIIKDPIIQTAVKSAAKLQKSIAEREAYLKEGKTSPSNDYVYNLEVSKFLNAKEAGQTFNSSYDQFSNWRKSGLEILKSMTGDSTITDDAFTLDKNGKIVIADAVTRTNLSGISPEKIQEALLNGLSPADLKQMQIDSIYNYANQDANQFKTTITDSFSEKIKYFNDQKIKLENAKPSTTDVEQKNKLGTDVESLNKYINNLNKQQASLLKMIDNNNLDGAKASFGTSNSISGFAKAFSNTQISKTYEHSELLEAQQFRETKEQDWKKFILGFDQDERFHKDTIREAKKANELKEKELTGYGGLPFTVAQEDVPKYNLNKLVQNVEDSRKQLANNEKLFLSQQGKDAAWLNQQRVAWEKSPNAVDPVIAAYFNNNAGMRREADANQSMINNINAEATKRFGSIDKLIPKGAPTVTYSAANGTRYTYSPKDFVNFNSKLNRYKTVTTTPTGSMTGTGGRSDITFNDELAKAELSPKEYKLYQIQKDRYYKGDGGLSKADVILWQNTSNYNKLVNQPYRKTINDINKFTADEVTKRLSASQGVSYQVPTASAAQKSTISTMMTQFADLAGKQKGGLANSPNYDVETAKLLAQDENTRYSIKVTDATSIAPATYKMVATGKNGQVEFNITPEQKQAVFGNQFESSPAIKMATPYIEQLNRMGGYTTSLDGKPSNLANTFLKKIDFPNVQNFGTQANIVQPYPGQYSIRLTIYDPLSGKWQNDLPYPKSGLIDESKIAAALIGINDSVIYEMLYNKPATSNDLNKIKQATKNPL